MSLACRPSAATLRRSTPRRLVTVGATATGRRHETLGQPCQDAVATRQTGKISVAVLADGAGSAAAAEIGARVAVDTVAALLQKRFHEFIDSSAESFGRALLGNIRRALARTARSMALESRDLACTLLACASDGRHLLVTQLGDGRVGIRHRATGQWHLLFEPAKGEFANETVFVTSESAPSHLRCARLTMSEVDAVVLMSDGTEASLFHRSTSQFAPAVETMRQWACATPTVVLRRVLRQNLEQALRLKTMDDCSLAFLIDRHHVDPSRQSNRASA